MIEDIRLMVCSEGTKDQAVALVSSLPPDERFYVHVGPYRDKRSNEQNKRLWWLHALTAAHLGLKGLGVWTKDRVHYRIFVPRYCRTARRIIVLGKETFEELSSSQLDPKEMTDAIDRYQADMINEGIEIPTEGPGG